MKRKQGLFQSERERGIGGWRENSGSLFAICDCGKYEICYKTLISVLFILVIVCSLNSRSNCPFYFVQIYQILCDSDSKSYKHCWYLIRFIQLNSYPKMSFPTHFSREINHHMALCCMFTYHAWTTGVYQPNLIIANENLVSWTYS